MTASILVCPTCGMTATPGSRFCEEDGTRLDGAATASAGGPASIDSGDCRCGTPFDPDEAGFCERCGVRIRPSQIQGPAVLGTDLAIATDKGLRHWRNEDAGAISQERTDGTLWQILVVCDGVSSASSSDRAAAIAADAARTSLVEALRAGRSHDLEPSVAEAIWAAHRAICEHDLDPEPDKDPPGATIVAAVAGPGLVAVGWLGDSRAYWLADGEARQLTRDDSWAAEQIESGALTLDEAMADPQAHAITHCIGPLEGLDTGDPCPPISPHTLRFCPGGPGLLVLCSDGLWLYASEPEALASLVGAARPDASAEALATSLVRYAVDSGGADNVIVGVARIL